VNDFIDPLNDPRFPDRPRHTDFWWLSDAVNYLDGQAGEGGHHPKEIVAVYADPDSVVYLCNQRVLRGTEINPALQTDLDLRALGMALWVDGFAIGCRYTEEQIARSTTPEGEEDAGQGGPEGP